MTEIEFQKYRVQNNMDGRKGTVVKFDSFYTRVEYDNGDAALYPSHNLSYWVKIIEEKGGE